MWNKNYKIILLSGLILCLFYSLAAQEDEDEDEDKDIIVKAKLWTASGDTITCHILYINQYHLQFSVTEVDTSGNFIRHFSPKDLSGFSYFISDEKNVFISILNPEDMGRIFLRRVYQGKYIVYQYLTLSRGGSSLSFLANYYLWDGDWLKPAISKPFEIESLLHHFSDCPELEYKIKTGEYGLSDIEKILKEYEDCKLTDEYEFFYE